MRSSYLMSFRSSLESHPSWITLYMLLIYFQRIFFLIYFILFSSLYKLEFVLLILLLVNPFSSFIQLSCTVIHSNSSWFCLSLSFSVCVCFGFRVSVCLVGCLLSVQGRIQKEQSSWGGGGDLQTKLAEKNMV